MPTITAVDVERMRDQLFVDGPRASEKSSRFWMLLVLSAVIASAGVIGDSTATVIGAMIVAPLMTPILGIVLGIALADRRNLLRSVLLVVGGAAAVIILAYLLGELARVPVVASTNSQVAGRVSPRLIDLVAALATGAVGSFALCRSDISDTLPGVAIAISLVPPLAVVGLTLESGAPHQAAGALLLFATNVAAILATGLVVMALYGVHRTADATTGRRPSMHRTTSVVVVAGLIVVVAFPLATTSAVMGRSALNEDQVGKVARAWAADGDWAVTAVSTQGKTVVVQAQGEGAPPSALALKRDLRAAGLQRVPVRVVLVADTRIELPD